MNLIIRAKTFFIRGGGVSYLIYIILASLIIVELLVLSFLIVRSILFKLIVGTGME